MSQQLERKTFRKVLSSNEDCFFFFLQLTCQKKRKKNTATLGTQNNWQHSVFESVHYIVYIKANTHAVSSKYSLDPIHTLMKSTGTPAVVKTNIIFNHMTTAVQKKIPSESGCMHIRHKFKEKEWQVQILTPSQQTEAPETLTCVAEGRQKKGVEIEGFHQEPEEVGHHTVVTEDHRGLTGKLPRRNRQKQAGAYGIFSVKGRRCVTTRGQNSPVVSLTVERVQWLVSSLENRAASFMNTATAFRINVMKSWMWMKFRAQRSLLLGRTRHNTTPVFFCRHNTKLLFGTKTQHGTHKKKSSKARSEEAQITPHQWTEIRNGHQRNVVKSGHSLVFIFPSHFIFFMDLPSSEMLHLFKEVGSRSTDSQWISLFTTLRPILSVSMVSMLKMLLITQNCKYDKYPVNHHIMINSVASLDCSYLKSSRINTATASSTRDTL